MKLTLPSHRSSETGIIECPISLPCNPQHTFGSACIAKWLKLGNTCPTCRHELFPLAEDDTDEDETDFISSGDDTDEDEAEPISSEADNERYIELSHAEYARTARMSVHVHTHCVALHLNDSVIQCSQNIGDIATRMPSLTGRSETSIAAASVYLASHLRGQPKTFREIAQLVPNTEGAIQTVYRRMYAHHHSLPAGMRGEIFGHPPVHTGPEDGQSSSVSIICAFFSCAFVALVRLEKRCEGI